MSTPDDEPFLQRWLRRKSEAASGQTQPEESVEESAEESASADPAGRADAPTGEASAAARESAGDAPEGVEALADSQEERPITDADLPDLDELGEDSDYSMFMAAGVSPEKKRAALRKLFQSPKFNVIDGLDDYCEDYTSFDPLGSIVTAEMRHHAERLARKALEALEGSEAEATVDAASADADAAQAPDAVAAAGEGESGTAGRSPDESAAAEEPATPDRSTTRNG